MSVVLHRRGPSHLGYEVQGTSMIIDRAPAGGWRIISLDTSFRAWLSDNHISLTHRFARLSDVRELLEALFATDPPPTLRTDPVRIRKEGSNRWEAVSASGEKYSIWRDEQSGYKLMRHLNGYITHSPSLAMVDNMLRRI